jgi:hypothetical protein
VFTRSGGQRTEGFIELFFAKSGEKAEASEVDSKDWNVCAVEEFGAEQNGAVAAEREQNIDCVGELIKFKRGGGGEMGGGLFIGEQRNPEGRGFAFQTLEDIRGVRTFRICDHTGFFHGADCCLNGTAAQDIYLAEHSPSSACRSCAEAALNRCVIGGIYFPVGYLVRITLPLVLLSALLYSLSERFGLLALFADKYLNLLILFILGGIYLLAGLLIIRTFRLIRHEDISDFRALNVKKLNVFLNLLVSREK